MFIWMNTESTPVYLSSCTTSINLLVCSSTPFTLSTTRITLSTAVNVLYVSSAKSLWPGDRAGWKNGLVFKTHDGCSNRDTSLSFYLHKIAGSKFFDLIALTAHSLTCIGPPNKRNFSVNYVVLRHRGVTDDGKGSASNYFGWLIFHC